MIVNDIIATLYTIIGNADESELDYAIVVESLGSVLAQMSFEKILGNVDGVIIKEELVFNDDTGIKQHSFSDFGDPIYLEFNRMPIDECPVGQLHLYSDMGVQRVAFWSDPPDGIVRPPAYAQLSINSLGTLKVWYEPDSTPLLTASAIPAQQDSLKWCIAYRLAQECIPHYNPKDQFKQARLPVLALQIVNKAKEWKDIYLEQINKIGTGKPFPRLPFVAGV